MKRTKEDVDKREAVNLSDLRRVFQATIRRKDENSNVVGGYWEQLKSQRRGGLGEGDQKAERPPRDEIQRLELRFSWTMEGCRKAGRERATEETRVCHSRPRCRQEGYMRSIQTSKALHPRTDVRGESTTAGGEGKFGDKGR